MELWLKLADPKCGRCLIIAVVSRVSIISRENSVLKLYLMDSLPYLIVVVTAETL